MAENIEKKFLGTAGVQQLIANTRNEIATAEQNAKNYADSLADNYDAAGTAQSKMEELRDGAVKTNADHIGTVGNLKTEVKTDLVSAVNELHDEQHFHDNKTVLDSYNKSQTALIGQMEGYVDDEVKSLADGAVKTNTQHIGTMDNLATTAKSDLVTAINEVRNAVSVGGTAAAVTMEEKTTGLSDGVAKAYVLKQGENPVGTINIPKDMVVQSGSVVVNPDGQAAGTYIKLVLANATNDEIFVNVGNLVDIYTAKASAAQVQLAIDSSTREISASIVAGSVTATELAADAVTTVKIADGNVTKAKLSTDVQTSLGKADSAIQASDLGDLAVKDTIATADIVDKAVTKAKLEDSVQTSLGKADSAVQPGDLGTLAAKSVVEKTDLSTAVQESLGKADAANGYTDGKIEELRDEIGDLSQLDGSVFSSTNLVGAANELANDIGLVTSLETTAHDSLVAAINEVNAAVASFVEISASDIDAMFAPAEG